MLPTDQRGKPAEIVDRAPTEPCSHPITLSPHGTSPSSSPSPPSPPYASSQPSTRRASSPPQSPRPSSSPAPLSPSHSDWEDGDTVFAFESALRADLCTGVSLESALKSLFDSFDDPQASPRLEHNPRLRTLSAPILATLTDTPALCDDLRAVARLCRAVYALAEDDIRALRVHRPLPLSPQAPSLGISSVRDVAQLLARASAIVVLSGAGVSVSCGIPDFRSAGGLYDVVRDQTGLPDPQLVFDIDEFNQDPTLFYSFARHIIPSAETRPSATHRFIAELHRRGKLLRNYSQNIDGLECAAGVPADRLVLCHGSFLTARCMRADCGACVPALEIAGDVAHCIVPRCKTCAGRKRAKRMKRAKTAKRRRYESASSDDEDDELRLGGVLKPDIVFFGEQLPDEVAARVREDAAHADLVLVLGTSLKVEPVGSLPRKFPIGAPRVLVNRERVTADFDAELLGDCDDVVSRLRRCLRWGEHDDEAGADARAGAGTDAVADAGYGPDDPEHGVEALPPRWLLFGGASDAARCEARELAQAEERKAVVAQGD